MNRKSIFCFVLLAISLLSFFILDNILISSIGEDEYLNITVPSSVNIIFNEDETETKSPFYVDNKSLLSIIINNINMTSHNEWNIVPTNHTFKKNEKALSLALGGNSLLTGDNPVLINIPKNKRTDITIDISRGIFTSNISNEQALSMSINYEFNNRNFTASFDEDGGNIVDDIIQMNGTKFEFPSTQKDYYTFIGYKNATDTSDTKIYKAGEVFTMPIGNISFKAQWKKNTVQIMYHANGGTRYGNDGTPIDTPDPLTGEIYDFDFTTDSSGLASFYENGTEKGALLMKRTGYHYPEVEKEWILNSPESRIYQNGKGATKIQDIALLVGKNDELKIRDIKIDLYANWIIDTYRNEIDYILKGFKEGDANNSHTKSELRVKTDKTFTQNYNDSIIVDDHFMKDYQMPIPNGFESYPVIGICDIIEGCAIYPINSKINQPAAKISFIYYFTPIEYNITYNLNGGTLPSGQSNPSKYTILYGFDFVNPQKEGYTFDGWYIDGVKVTGINPGKDAKTNMDTYANIIKELSSRTTGDKIVEARWTPIEYSINYINTFNGENKSATQDKWGYAIGELSEKTRTYTIENDIILPTVKNAIGKNFLGWYDNPSFTGSPITSIQKGSTGDKTFYAKYAYDNFNLIFDLNGGTIDGLSGSKTYTGEYDEIFSFKEAKPIKAGYTFKGWGIENAIPHSYANSSVSIVNKSSDNPSPYNEEYRILTTPEYEPNRVGLFYVPRAVSRGETVIISFYAKIPQGIQIELKFNYPVYNALHWLNESKNIGTGEWEQYQIKITPRDSISEIIGNTGFFRACTSEPITLYLSGYEMYTINENARFRYGGFRGSDETYKALWTPTAYTSNNKDNGKVKNLNEKSSIHTRHNQGLKFQKNSYS